MNRLFSLLNNKSSLINQLIQYIFVTYSAKNQCIKLVYNLVVSWSFSTQNVVGVNSEIPKNGTRRVSQ